MEGIVRFQNTDIYYLDTGQGPVVVLLHGYLENKEIWKSIQPGLSAKYRVIAIDLPGHGQSGIIDQVHTMDLMAQAVHEVLKQLHINCIILVGHSMGGYVSLAYAENYPHHLSGLCLFHSHPFADNDEKKFNRDRAVELIRQGKKKQLVMAHTLQTFSPVNTNGAFQNEIERLKIEALQTPDEGIIAAILGMKSRPDHTALLRNIRIPVLIIAGGHDQFISQENYQSMKDLAPETDFLLLTESGHMGLIEEPGESLSGLFRFLDMIFKQQ